MAVTVRDYIPSQGIGQALGARSSRLSNATHAYTLLHLAEVYGAASERLLEEQAQRLEEALHLFERFYGSGPVEVFRAPGRVNLIGEHTDYNHGYVLPMALDKDILLLARPREDALVHLRNVEPTFEERVFAVAPDIPVRPAGDWANYAQGAAQLLAREWGFPLRGFDGLVDGRPPWGVPRGSGLSSSSALTVAVATALVAFNHLPLSGPRLADACGRAEWYVGTRGGIMDQFISILAQRDHALFLDCRPLSPGGDYHYEHVPIPAGYRIVVVDSRTKHLNTGPLFNRRVAEGRIGVRLLQRHYGRITHLRDVGHIPWQDLEPLLPEVITAEALRAQGIDPATILDAGRDPETDIFFVRRRCRHVITENQRVLESVRALQKGDAATFGALMCAAHASARDDYEISTPHIEALVASAQAAPGCLGARITGAGWGGCIVALVEAEAVADFERSVKAAYRTQTGLEAEAFICRSAPGAGCILSTTI